MPDIASIKIPLPSIVEQDKIVEKVWIDLKRIDRLDAQLQRQIDLLVERRQALIIAAVTGNSTSLEPRRSEDILTRAKISRRPP
jgi:type I restriction enzyme S subunit